jgi:uncharacterized integral membrane protein
MKPATNQRSGDRARNRRAFLPVFGGLLLGLMALVWFAQGQDSGNWPIQAWVLFWALIVSGLLAGGAGVLAAGTTREERLRSLPATGMKVLFGVLACAAWLGLVSGIHSVFPSLDNRALRIAATVSVTVIFGVVLLGAMSLFTIQSKRIKKRINRAMKNAHDGMETNQRSDDGLR